MSRISQSQLESYLWGAAEHLRGSIDAGDYKQFIFPLLFLKRLCDVHDEETAQALRASGGDAEFAAFAENHRFQVPAEAHWKEIRKETRNVGQAIQRAMRAIESANKDKLFGIFGDAQWSNKDRLSDETMRELIEHFSSLELTIANLPEDELGQGYEFLIKKFADDSGHTAAEFYTNRTVVHLMTEMLDVQPGESVYDPTCGSGGMLMSCVAHLRKQGKEWRNVRLFGQERNLMTSSIARMNCFLHGIEDFRIERGDTLAEPKLVEGDKLMQFDVVLANPPYSIKQWDREAFRSDPWGRNLFGVPPQGRADYAFQQHIIKSLKSQSGRSVALWPHGVLFRKEEDEIRQKLVESDLIEAVIGLGHNLFYNSAMQSCLLVVRMNKPKERKGKILFIDASQEVTEERAQSFLSKDNRDKILKAYARFTSTEGFSKVADLQEIRSENYSLNIPLYVRPGKAGLQESKIPNLAESDCLQNWLNASSDISTAIERLIPELKSRVVPSSRGSRLKPGWIDRTKWIRVKLGEVCEEISERINDPANQTSARFVGLEHMDSGELKVRRWGSPERLESAMKLFRAGDVLFARRNAYLKRASLVDFDGICSGDAIVLRENNAVVVPGYLALVLNTDKFWSFAVANAAGTMSRRVNGKTLANYEFDLPPLDQQRRIAEILWAIDELHQRTLDVLKSSEAAEQSLSNELFQKTAEKYRIRADQVCSKITVGIVVKPASFYTDPEQGVPALRSLNVFPGRFDLEELVYISPEGQKKHEKSRLCAGDVAIIRTGRPGDAVVIPASLEGANLIDLILVRTKPELKPEYLAEFMNSAYGKKVVLRGSAGTAQQHLNVGEFEKIELPCPPLTEQENELKRLREIRAPRESTLDLAESTRLLLISFINQTL